MREAWGREIEAGAPVDQLDWFVSPLTRTCQTFLDSWQGLYKPPEVWEVSRSEMRKTADCLSLGMSSGSGLRGEVIWSPP